MNTIQALIFSVCITCGCTLVSAKEYTDAEIEKILVKWTPKPGDDCLSVVPNGQTKRIGQIFKNLGLDPVRVGRNRSSGMNMVTFLYWKVSPSYELFIMTGSNHKMNDYRQPMQLEGYGVRISKVAEEKR